MHPEIRTVPATLLVAGATAAPAQAQQQPRFGIEFEAGPVWQSRNDVRIPNAPPATEFSVVDLIGDGPYGAFRLEFDFDINERHGFRFTWAPLRIEDTGVLSEPVFFVDQTFLPDTPTNAVYQFSSYRLAYRYRFYKGARWRWKVGFTAFIRDAVIALEQPERAAEDTDLGFVPLLNLRGEGTISGPWRFIFDFDGLAVPGAPGRALDAAAKVGYRFADDWELAFGYRTIEGGVDIDDVFNFAWLNFLVGSIRYDF